MIAVLELVTREHLRRSDRLSMRTTSLPLSTARPRRATIFF
jgi:hypothetical protein